MKNPQLAAALSYLRKHSWCVIPLHPRTKKAMVKWKDYAKRLPTEQEVRSWWRRYPQANVGIVTGAISGLVVVDIDPDKGGNAKQWQRSYPTGLMSRTGRGGIHLYYSYPKGLPVVRNSASKVAAGVDVRGDGGYVAAPPSVHANGKRYVWIERGDAAMAPSVVLGSAPSGNGHSTAVTEHWLERVLLGVGHGERNDACARLAGYLFKKKIPNDVVLAQMLGWNRLNDPPLPESEVRQTVESIARTAAENNNGQQRTTPTFELEPEDEDAGPIGAYDTIGFDDYLSKYGSVPLTWLVRDWLPQQTVGMVVAPPGSYKTWLLQDLAVSVASGMPFLGKFAVERTGPVLFMQQEDWHGQIAHRFALITARRAGMRLPRMVDDWMVVHAPPTVPIHLHEHRRFHFEDDEVVNAWVEKVKAIRPALIILDPLYSAGAVEDFMAGTARNMFLFKSMRDALGTTFLIAHHTRKSANLKAAPTSQTANNAPEREDVWGSQFLNAWIETGWQIRRREEAGTATIARHFKVSSDANRSVLGFKIDTTVNPGRYEVEVHDVVPGEKDKVDLVVMLEEKGPSTAEELSAASGLNRSTITRRLKNLTAAGLVVPVGSKYTLRDTLEVQNG